jgi:hypothetical protein
MTERDHRTLKIVSKNHTTTAAQVTAELNIHVEDSVSTKTFRYELHKHGMVAIDKSLITKSNAQMISRQDPKTWTSDNWKCAREVR